MEVQEAHGPFSTEHTSFEAFLDAHLALLRNGQYELIDDGYLLEVDGSKTPVATVGCLP